MKATSIEQIREHLARGGRVAWLGLPVDVIEIDGAVITFSDVLQPMRQVCLSGDELRRWELLPLDEKHAGDCTVYSSKSNGMPTDGICTCGVELRKSRDIPGIPASTLPIVTEDPTGESSYRKSEPWAIPGVPASTLSIRQAKNSRVQILINGNDTGAGERIRKALLFGSHPSMPDLLSWWEATTGERIEHGRRCNACECSGGDGVLDCSVCNGSGYTVRPTWMGERG